MKVFRWMISLFITLALVVGMCACGRTESSGETKGKNTDVSEITADSNANDSTVASGQNISKEASDDDTENGTRDAEPDEIVVLFAGTSQIPNDLKMVEDEINKISREKINVVIDLQCFTIGDFQQQVNLMITSGEQIDLMSTIPLGSAQFTAMCSQNQFEPLDELLEEYGQGIIETVGTELLASTTAKGHIYGVPSYNNKAQDTYFCIRTDIMEKYGLEDKVKGIKSVEDITEILETIKGDDSFVAPIGGKQTTFTNSYGFLYDTVDDPLMFDSLGAASLRLAGVAVDQDKTQVINLYEQEAYARLLDIIRDWYNKGLIYKDSATYSESSPALVTNNVIACYFCDSELGVEVSQSLATGCDITCVKVLDGIIDSGRMRQFVWGIPTVAKEPEAAMKFMDLMYTNADIVNLLTWGIEGVHYEAKADGTIGLPEGVTSENSGYYLGGLDFLFGNTFLAKVWEGNDPNLRQNAKAAMDSHRVSPLVGFSIDTSQLENEITAISNAVSEYRYSLECGIFDPADSLKEFREKLKSCGADKYIEEVQRQLDEYLKEVK